MGGGGDFYYSTNLSYFTIYSKIDLYKIVLITIFGNSTKTSLFQTESVPGGNSMDFPT